MAMAATCYHENYKSAKPTLYMRIERDAVKSVMQRIIPVAFAVMFLFPAVMEGMSPRRGLRKTLRSIGCMRNFVYRPHLIMPTKIFLLPWILAR